MFTLQCERNRDLWVIRYLTIGLLAGALMMIPIPNRARAEQSGGAMSPPSLRRQQPTERIHPPPSTQTMYAPGGLKRFSQAEIVLNNNGPENMDVTSTFYTTEGAAVDGKTVTLKPAEARNMAVSDLMLLDHLLKKVAGMSLTYFGGMMEVGAQITLPAAEGAGSVDVPFSSTMDYHSTVQEAVWWMPKNAEATIILGNATGEQIVARLKYGNGESQDVQLGPFATEIVERRNDQASIASENGVAESVRIELSGPVGSLRATGFVNAPAKRFSSGIRFYDPATIRQPHLFATNLRLKQTEARLVLKNVGDRAILATPRFLPISGESGRAFELAAMSVEPHQAVNVDLKSLRKAAKKRSDFDVVSVQVVNGSGENNLIGALYSSDAESGITYDVPLRDSGPVSHSTGSYPWRLDADYSTIISITNTHKNASRYLATVNYEGGRYSLNPKDLAAGETVVFDLRKIRDEQAPDKDGNTIPLSVTGGQFRWSLIDDDTHRLIGRSEVVSLSNAVSSSYSCPVCCPDSFAGLEITPGSSSGPVGGTATLAVDGFFIDCNNWLHGPYAWWPNSGSWVQYPSVLSLAMVSQGSAQMSCLSVGTSQFEFDTFETWYTNDGMDCYSNNSNFPGTGSGEVLAVWTLGTVQFTSPSGLTIRPGETGQLSVSVSASAGMPANASVTLEITFGADGDAVISVDPNSVSITTGVVAPGSSHTFTISFTANSSQPNPGGPAVHITGHARLTGEMQSTVSGMREKDSSNMLTLQKP